MQVGGYVNRVSSEVAMLADKVSSEVAMPADRVSSDNSKVDRYRTPSDVAMLADSGWRQTWQYGHTAYRSSNAGDVTLITGYY